MSKRTARGSASADLTLRVPAHLATLPFIDVLRLFLRLEAESRGNGKSVLRAPSADRLPGLSRAERKVFDLLADAHPIPSIAKRLGWTRAVVEAHRAAIHRKLGVASRADLLAFARFHGLVPHSPAGDEEVVLLPCDLETLERRAVAAALRATGDSTALAAKLLGVNRATLYRRFRKLLKTGAPRRRVGARRPRGGARPARP